MLRALVFAAGALTAAADAAPQVAAPDKNACVFFRTIHDFKALDRNNLVIWAPGRRSAYLVEVGMPLPDLTWANELGFIDSNNDGRLCGFGMDRIVIADTSFPQRSTITAMTPLDAAALEGLEQQYKVKLTRGKKAAEK